MKKIKSGDIVGRISYNKDIFFIVDRIIYLKNSFPIAILKGVTERIKADSFIDDLELIDEKTLRVKLNEIEERMRLFVENSKSFQRRNSVYGSVLHLDGDSRYSQKSARYYRNLGIDAVVRNVPESRQPRVVSSLLNKYKPDILIITGHDGMIKNGADFSNIYNYRNSIYFMRSVSAARRWENNSNKLAIFARCMSKLL